jgi:hypothetical protein
MFATASIFIFAGLNPASPPPVHHSYVERAWTKEYTSSDDVVVFKNASSDDTVVFKNASSDDTVIFRGSSDSAGSSEMLYDDIVAKTMARIEQISERFTSFDERFAELEKLADENDQILRSWIESA